MKTLSRILAALMVLSMILTLSASAFAANTNATINTTKTGSITLYKYDLTAATKAGVTTEVTHDWTASSKVTNAYKPYAIEGVEFTYAKISDVMDVVTVDSTDTATVCLAYGIANADLAAKIGLTADDVYTNVDGTNYYTTTAIYTALDNALTSDPIGTKNTLEAWAKDNGKTMVTNADGVAAATKLPVGLYLIVETKVPKDVTCTAAPFVASVPTTINNVWTYNLHAYVKNNTGAPDLEKLVKEDEADTGTEDYAHTASASIEDQVDYEIISQLPTITSHATSLSQYTFVDTLDDGVTYNRGDVTISWYTDKTLAHEITSWKDTDGKYTVSYNEKGDQMTIAMTTAGLTEINTATTVYTTGVDRGYSQCVIVIRYAGTVNVDAKLGDTGNTNEVELKWSRTNESSVGHLYDDCHVYSYGLVLTKEFVSGDTTLGNFKDVRFVMKNADDNYYVKAEQVDGIYYVKDHVAESEATALIPDSNGKIQIRGLEPDAYEITETATSKGYALLADSIKVVIETKESTTICEMCEKALLTASATVGGKSVAMLADGESINAVAPLTVVNHRPFLPNTGEAGTLWLSVLGLCGMAAMAVVIVLLTKKRKTN